MKKTLIAIFALALLGGLDLYFAQQESSSSAPATAKNSAASGDIKQAPDFNYKDGKFTGSASATPYGNVQIAVVISGGKITDVQFLQMPDDESRSRQITVESEPLLKSSTLSKQNAASIDMVSGATSTTFGYRQSLQAALDQAKLN